MSKNSEIQEGQQIKKKKRSYASSLWKYVSSGWNGSTGSGGTSGSSGGNVSVSTSDKTSSLTSDGIASPVTAASDLDVPVVRVLDDDILDCMKKPETEISDFEPETIQLPPSLEKCNTDQEVMLYLDHLISTLHNKASTTSEPTPDAAVEFVQEQVGQSCISSSETESETSYDSMPELEEVPLEENENHAQDETMPEFIEIANPAWDPSHMYSPETVDSFVKSRRGNVVIITPPNDFQESPDAVAANVATAAAACRRRSRRPPTPYVSRETSQEDDSHSESSQGPLKRVRMNEQEDIMSRLERGEYKPKEVKTVAEDVRIEIELDPIDYSDLLDRIESRDGGCATLCDAVAEMWNDIVAFFSCLKEKIQ